MSKWPSFRIWAATAVSVTLHGLVVLALLLSTGPSSSRGLTTGVQSQAFAEVSLVSAATYAGVPGAATDRKTAPKSAPSKEASAEAAQPIPPDTRTEAQSVQAADASGGSAAAASAAPPLDGQAVDLYSQQLMDHIRRYRGYPLSARRDHVEGQVILHFVMDREGHVLDAYIERSSGAPSLDAEALATISRAQPLPTIPDALPNRLSLTLPVTFHLQS